MTIVAAVLPNTEFYFSRNFASVVLPVILLFLPLLYCTSPAVFFSLLHYPLSFCPVICVDSGSAVGMLMGDPLCARIICLFFRWELHNYPQCVVFDYLFLHPRGSVGDPLGCILHA
ncbi:hypothetical protein, unlikely [Trypanosoma brucei gambiense DAL972]|uniref:Uncharacterized protein n=1 Tax=Trypanosoma brucei gambiense (strain MHOM/CI/86/DAL972) TaxID=679716 RepID=C9ZJQ7_TRYB9|nr:hypothetical protein, unlikely [Trypanosoma brucei gambiense DAL972]CBH09617.1 hypothetical protein, unlikely [Trypanosoma brucei gambiense DAL972]|eukprot:XP_011771921.1 hypothetical protein, unlikely [Trypanosoma brucei gambiense DAL972]